MSVFKAVINVTEELLLQQGITFISNMHNDTLHSCVVQHKTGDYD